ncbi:MAG: hypothetical protein ACWGO1_14010, partial [Anaerolineales bacterium]
AQNIRFARKYWWADCHRRSRFPIDRYPAERHGAKSCCSVRSSIIRNSILEEEAHVTDVVLEDSLIGRRAQIQRRTARINAGDHTVLIM